MFIKPFLFIPVFISLLYLVAGLLHLLNESTAGILETFPYPIVTIVLFIGLLIFKKMNSSSGWPDNLIYTVPGFMAATAIFNPWSLVPSHLPGVAWGGLEYFLEIVTVYPDVGSINSQVFIGILAMLGTCYLPVVIAWCYLVNCSKLVMISLILFYFPLYMAVTVYLDFNLWLTLLYVTEHYSLDFLLYGPISRLLAFISTFYLAILLVFDNKSSNS